jgi:4-nitrophenyl phosphatase
MPETGIVETMLEPAALEIVRQTRGVILDMDGVLYRGNTLIPEVPAFLAALEAAGISYMMATNNATALPEDFSAKLANMGIKVSPEHIATSAVATATYAKSGFPAGTKVFVVGMNALRKAMFEDGYFVEATTDARLVVSGADFDLRYESLKIACLAIRAGAEYVATNADKTFPTEYGLIPGSGAIVAALMTSTDIEPVIVGKPSPVMVHSCLELMGLDADQAIMLGDRLDTDILAGQRAGTPTALVLTGITTEADLNTSDIEPDIVVPTLDDLTLAIHATQRSR